MTVAGVFCIKSVTDILNRQPTSQMGHQHPKIVTNTFRLQYRSPTSMQSSFGSHVFQQLRFYHFQSSTSMLVTGVWDKTGIDDKTGVLI